MSHVSIRRITHINKSCHTNESVTSHVAGAHTGLRSVNGLSVARMNESRHTCMIHVTRMNEARHTYECVMSHICERVTLHMAGAHKGLRSVDGLNESCHTYQLVASHISTSHVTQMNECQVHEMDCEVSMDSVNGQLGAEPDVDLVDKVT